MTVKLAFHLRDAAAFDQRLAFRDPSDHKSYDEQENEKKNYAQRRVCKVKHIPAEEFGFLQYCTISHYGKCGKNTNNKAFAHKIYIFSFPRHDGYPHDDKLRGDPRNTHYSLAHDTTTQWKVQ